jgi:two-component system, response regulator YesN
MYKLIIVDDEKIVREGLKKTIQWEEHGFKLVGDYKNGREALDDIDKVKPDLILSDICMPLMDGLELCEQVVANYPFIKTVILTGHDDFDYAQRALRLKVEDFILKPFTARDTRQILNKIKQTMDEEQQLREDFNLLYNQLNQSLPLLRERFLERMVVTGISQREMTERLAYFNLPPLGPRFLTLIFDIDDFGERESESIEPDTELLRFAGFNLLEEIVVRESGFIFRTREERMVAVISGELGEEALYDQGFRIVEEARQYIEKFLKYTVTVGIGRVYDSPGMLPHSYQSALSALDYRLLLGKNRVISISDVEGQDANVLTYSADWDRQLASLVKIGSKQEAKTLIEQIIADLKGSSLSIDSCYLQILKVVVSLLNTIQELGVSEELLGTDQRIVLTDLYKYKTLDEIKVWLQSIVQAAMTAVSEIRQQVTTTQMIQAIDYIHRNYGNEKLSLQDLCRYVLMSKSYFSLVFKQYTGETFVEFLTRVRTEHAKTLLQHSTLKFYEIASKVGYADPNYFSLLFKKVTGMTPKEYREKQTKEIAT